MKPLVMEVARQVADHPADLAVTELAGRHTIVMELRCNPRDIGRIIGRNGRTVNALRILLNAAAARAKKRVILEVVGRE